MVDHRCPLIKITSLLPMRQKAQDPQLHKRNHGGDIGGCDFRPAIIALLEGPGSQEHGQYGYNKDESK
jgi:hypothetical protein